MDRESARLRSNAKHSRSSRIICWSSREDRKLQYSYHNAAAASTAPLALKVLGLATTTSTGYFHCMNLAQPRVRSVLLAMHSSAGILLPQYATFLPMYFPMYGTTNIVSSNSSCCMLSLHSLSASDSSCTSSSVVLVSVEGSESISSESFVRGGEGSPSSTKDVEADVDIY